MIKLTIIVPVYNASKTLTRCIDSILAQTVTDLECILVDDGSLDDSREICGAYKRKDNRIVVICKKNEGVSVARNAALDIARGEWIGFVDSDDWIEKQMFQSLLENAIKKQADISVCAFYEVYGEYQSVYPDNRPDMILDSNNAVLELLDMESFGGYSCNKLVKAELFQGIRYDPSVQTMSDVLVFYQIFKRAKKIIYSPKPYYNYVQNPDSIVHKHGLAKRATGLS
ncbi:MAG: glycosyltransferase, partial [Bacteroidales bacterium]|nr:glycosyltransferase [Bacteroidales bacterium]